MGRYVLRRVLVAIPIAWAAVSLLFVLFFLLPGDPASQIAGSGSRELSDRQRAAIEARYDLDQPWYVQYGTYWGRLVRGDLGESFQSRVDVGEVVADTAPASLRLAFWAIVGEAVIGVSAGVVAAVRRRTFVDGLVTVTTTAAVAVPVFLLGYLLQYVFGVYPYRQGWPDWARLPVQGIGPDSWVLGVIPVGDQWRYLVLPAFTLAVSSAAIIARLTRSSVIEALRSDHLRTARAMGLAPRTLRWRALRSGLVPVVTFLGIDFAALVGSAVLTETVFNWPGMGSALADAVSARDTPIVLGLTMVLVVIYVVVSLVVDVVYGFLDPRIRVGRERVA